MTTPRARSARGKNLGQSAEAIHAPTLRSDRRTADEVRSTLAEIDLDPIRELGLLAKSATDERVRGRALETLAPFLVPRQKAESEAMEEMRRRLETVQRYVIVGEAEDASGADWEARNAHWREWLLKRDANAPREPSAAGEGLVQ